MEFYHRLTRSADPQCLLADYERVRHLPTHMQYGAAYGGIGLQSDGGGVLSDAFTGAADAFIQTPDGWRFDHTKWLELFAGRSPSNTVVPTEANIGVFRAIHDDLVALGCEPYRGRLSYLYPGQSLKWHVDSVGTHWTLHIPLITSSECRFEWKTHNGQVSIWLPADGHFWLCNTSAEHRVINHSADLIRVHLMFRLRNHKPLLA